MSLDVYLNLLKKCPHCGEALEPECVYSDNITHNLNKMAEAAGIYYELWRPEELGITTAKELISPLNAGLDRLLKNRSEYIQYNPSNGWGSYEGLLGFVASYLAACEANPEAIIEVSR
jgi:hypothetical protein